MSREEQQEERWRRFRSIFPLLVVTALGGTALGEFFPDIPWAVLSSFIVLLLGAWVFGIWYVRKGTNTP